MNEHRISPAQLNQLVDQDPVVSSFNYPEFRMNLEQSIQQLRDRAARTHRAALVSLACFLLVVVTGPFIAQLENVWLLRIWSGCGVFCLVTTGILAAIDHYKYRPVLKQKQNDLIWLAIEQLRLQVAEIRNQAK